MISIVNGQAKKYTISGHIANLPDGVTFYLIQVGNDGGADTISRVKSKNQQFIFKSSLENEGQLAFVKMDTLKVKLESRSKTWLTLFLDSSSSNIRLKGDIKVWPDVEISGSELTKQFEQFNSQLKTFANILNQKLKGNKLTFEEVQKEYGIWYLNKMDSLNDSYIVPYLLFKNGTLDIMAREAGLLKMSDKQKNSFYGKKLKDMISGIKASKNIGIGKVIPDFEIKTPEGKTKSVRKLATQAKYTLIDFWAYWCKPCRDEIPNLKKVYAAFQDRGFNILSISTDPSVLKWKQALKEDNTPWLNGMQVENPSKDIFGLTAIPAYILLNDKAEIIQMDINSKYFSESLGTIRGAPIFVVDSKRLRVDDLYKLIEVMLEEDKLKN